MLTRALFALVLVCGMAAGAAADETKVLALGLTDHVPAQDELEGGADLAGPRFDSPGVAYALVANVKRGDTVEVALTKDGTSLMHNTRELEADEDKVLLLAGKTGVPAGGWPDGLYTATVTVMRDGKPVVEQRSDPVPFE
jgi:hypothetical protein